MDSKLTFTDKSPQLEILRHAVENTNEGFVTIDEGHKVLFFNKAAEKIFGYSRDEVVGYDLDVILSTTCSRNHHEAVRRTIKTRVPGVLGHETEMMAARKNGEVFLASISFSQTELDGKLFFTGIVKDMTETRALQEQIMQCERVAGLGQMVAEIIHEIKNPLMMIGGFARQLIRAVDGENHLKKLRVIAEEVKRLEKLLSDLREFYAPKSLTIEPVDIKGLLAEVHALVRDDCDKQNIRTHLKVDETPLVVAGNPSGLKQVFLNLIKNSMEAIEDGGTIAVQSRLTGGHVEITLSDDGCGISEDDQGKVFSRFFSRKSGGTGLGLCVSKRIIDEVRGASLSFHSKEGEGTTFKVTLPLYEGHPG
jgi:PAS domain S-box-containing protein